MRRRAKSDGDEKNIPDVRALEMLLDYAMMEGAELRLPLFVFLLRAAQLELKARAGSGVGLHESSHKPKFGERPETAEVLSFAARVPERCIEGARDVHGPQSVIQDR
jgi:hypothetical protein